MHGRQEQADEDLIRPRRADLEGQLSPWDRSAVGLDGLNPSDWNVWVRSPPAFRTAMMPCASPIFTPRWKNAARTDPSADVVKCTSYVPGASLTDRRRAPSA